MSLTQLHAAAHEINDAIFAGNEMPTLRASDGVLQLMAADGLRTLLLEFVKRKSAIDPAEAERQRKLASYVYDVLQETKAELNAMKLTTNPEQWAAFNTDLKLFEQFARAMFKEIFAITHTFRPKTKTERFF